MGIDRYECVFTDNAKIAEPLEITAIRCNKRTPEISLWSLSSGGRGGSRFLFSNCCNRCNQGVSGLARFFDPDRFSDFSCHAFYV